jgi:hypothetical protein
LEKVSPKPTNLVTYDRGGRRWIPACVISADSNSPKHTIPLIISLLLHFLKFPQSVDDPNNFFISPKHTHFLIPFVLFHNCQVFSFCIPQLIHPTLHIKMSTFSLLTGLHSLRLDDECLPIPELPEEEEEEEEHYLNVDYKHYHQMARPSSSPNMIVMRPPPSESSLSARLEQRMDATSTHISSMTRHPSWKNLQRSKTTFASPTRRQKHLVASKVGMSNRRRLLVTSSPRGATGTAGAGGGLFLSSSQLRNMKLSTNNNNNNNNSFRASPRRSSNHHHLSKDSQDFYRMAQAFLLKERKPSPAMEGQRNSGIIRRSPPAA